jgi:hypothetical protein
MKRRLGDMQLTSRHAEIHRIGNGRESDNGIEVEAGRQG